MVLEEPGVLKRTYVDLNGDGFDDLLLTGFAVWSDADSADYGSRGEFNAWDQQWLKRELVRKVSSSIPPSVCSTNFLVCVMDRPSTTNETRQIDIKARPQSHDNRFTDATAHRWHSGF